MTPDSCSTISETLMALCLPLEKQTPTFFLDVCLQDSFLQALYSKYLTFWKAYVVPVWRNEELAMPTI
jgi:hypothetical protein